MATVPTRWASVLAATANCTDPGPAPAVPDTTVIQGTFELVVHAQSVAAVTPTVAVPPAASAATCSGAIAYVHPPSCLIENVRPAAVTVPVRSGPVFAATVRLTVPFPEPAAPLPTAIHGALLVAVQAHPPVVCTSKVRVPPAAGTSLPAAESANVQPWPWFTVNGRPAIVSVPDRAGPVVAETVKRTVPFATPLDPSVTRIQSTGLAAVHGQPLPLVTFTVPVPPAAATDCDVGSIEYAHPCDCVTVTRCPATRSVPLRDGPFVAATANETVPVPAPVAPLASVIHGTSLAADQSHPAVEVTVTVPFPPAAPIASVSGDTSNLQPGDCVTVKRCPATVIVALRGGPVVGATSKTSVVVPFPLAPDRNVTQAASETAVHVHSALEATTSTDPEPPV
jgi:hypothetical protein